MKRKPKTSKELLKIALDNFEYLQNKRLTDLEMLIIISIMSDYYTFLERKDY